MRRNVSERAIPTSKHVWGNPPPEVLDPLVSQTASYFYEREEMLLSVDPDELCRS